MNFFLFDAPIPKIPLPTGVISSSVAPIESKEPLEIRGKVVLPDKSIARFAVVWLEGSDKSSPMKGTRIDQREKTFLPHVLVVTPGTKVSFPNNDTVFHNVFAYFDAKRFDLGMYPQGATKTVTFDKPGIVSVLCNVHPKMSAFVVVVDSPYFAVTGRNGEFRIPSVPSGKYILHAWHESGATFRSAVNIDTVPSPVTITLENR